MLSLDAFFFLKKLKKLYRKETKKYLILVKNTEKKQKRKDR